MADWHKKAIELHQEGLGAHKIAAELGLPFSTVNTYLYRWRKKEQHYVGERKGHEERKPIVEDCGDYYIIKNANGTRKVTISKASLRVLKQLYCEQKLTINQVCRELDIPRRDFWLIKTAFAITKDDVPVLDQDLDGNIDQLVEESLERKKQQYFIKLQQREIESAFKELEQYRKQDYFLGKIHRLMLAHQFDYDGPKVPFRPRTSSGLMLEVPIVDLHLAKLSWEPETGENYDSKIAEKRFMGVIYDVVERAQKYEFEQIVFPIGNDFFNYDDLTGSTTKGTPQDNDSRWQKLFLKGTELLVKAIDLLAQLAPVRVFQIPGNHDTMVSWYAVCYLQAWFKNHSDVKIDTNPRSRKYVEFGKCLIGFTHGDKEKKRIFGNMQVEVPEAWGRTLYREWHTGHLHSEQVKEEHGVKVRSLSSVTAKDAWHYVSGYVGALAASQSFVWDKEKGLREIWYSTVS